MPIKQVELSIDYHVRYLCENPYPNHPKGCPNYHKRLSCPPAAPFIETIIDLKKPVYVIWNVFDFGTHVQKMKALHPNWSQRQLDCCLYWQGTARKQLGKEIDLFIISRYSEAIALATTIERGIDYIPNTIIRCPEAMGVNVTKTMAAIREIFEWPPVTKTYQVAIAGRQI